MESNFTIQMIIIILCLIIIIWMFVIGFREIYRSNKKDDD
jgi:hypothetical protein